MIQCRDKGTGTVLGEITEAQLQCVKIIEIDGFCTKVFMQQCVDLGAPADAGYLIAQFQQVLRYGESDTGTGSGHQGLLAFTHASHRGDRLHGVCAAALRFHRNQSSRAPVPVDS